MFFDLETPGEKSTEKSDENSDYSPGLSPEDEGAEDESGEDKMSGTSVDFADQLR